MSYKIMNNPVVGATVQINVDVQNARGVTITGNTMWQGFTHDVLVKNCANVVAVADSASAPAQISVPAMSKRLREPASAA